MESKDIKLKIQSFLWMIISYLIFIFFYKTAGIYTSNLESVPSFYLPWEKNIPFIPWLVIPYMSSGVFFVIIFLLCKTKESLYRLVKQINSITIISSIAFFIFPLKFAFEKPEIKNCFLSIFFQFFERMDNSFNQCPSLHISYAVLFAVVFQKEIKNKVKYIFHIWFLLMGLSTLFIYQHHIIDIISALLLVIFILFIFSEKVNERNRKIGFIYFLLSVIFLSTGIIFFNWSIILFFPSLTFFLIGKAYIENNSSFIKKEAKITLYNKIIYFPYLFCYNILWKFFRKYERNPWKEIVPNVFIGSKLNDRQVKEFILNKKIIIIDLSAEAEENMLLKEKGEYYSFPLLDICNFNEDVFLSALKLVLEKYKNLGKNEKIYIHCLMGYSRSTALGAAFLKNNYQIETNEAVSLIKKIVKYAVIPDYILDVIKKY